MTDQLFLMKPGFINAGMGPFYCGDSVSVEGLLGFFPQLRELIEVTYVDFARPRAPIVALIGEENQSVPVLVLEGAAPDGISAKHAGKVAFLDNEKRFAPISPTSSGCRPQGEPVRGHPQAGRLARSRAARSRRTRNWFGPRVTKDGRELPAATRQLQS